MKKTRPNPNQRIAIEATEGPVLIIAGPGSGKTFTLVERIVYLIDTKNVEPSSILVATFTEKAAKELISRVSNKVLEMGMKVNLNEMYIGTLHSIFLRILEENREHTRLSKNYRVLDAFDQKYFVYEKIKEFEKLENSDCIIGNYKTQRWRKAEALIESISKVSEEVLDIDELLKSGDDEIVALAESYKLYSELMAEENSLDFSSIQSEANIILNDHPEVREELQRKIKYMLIDEYQDTNTIQEMILFKLMNPETKNICVVGDDDQGLYRFRGATIRNILEFSNNFEPNECKVINLKTNYRSHPKIIDFYNRWMSEKEWIVEDTSFRHSKVIEPVEREFPEYQSVIKVSAEDNADLWHSNVLEFIQTMKSKGILTDYNQIAFLFNSVKNDKAIELAEFLEKNDIKVFSPRSALFFDRDEIKLMMGALIFIFPNLFEVLEKYTKSKYTVWDYYGGCLDLFASTIKNAPKKHSGLLKWCQYKAKTHLHLAKNADYGFSGLFYELLKFPMFSKYLDKDLNSNAYDLRASYNLALFSKLLTKFEFYNRIRIFLVKNINDTLRKFYNHFLRYLIDGGMEEYEDFDDYAPSGCVSFMTIHQSKGLEFPVVFVGSLYTSPRKQYNDLDVALQNDFYRKEPFEPIDKTKFYDFWRLYYTAFSRAQNMLVLTANEKEERGRTPSKHFTDIYKPITKWDDENVHLDEVELEKMKPVKIKNEYAFTSDILLYENCPLQYKFFKEMAFAPVRTGAFLFGILVHETIEDIHRAVLSDNTEKVNNENIENWLNANYQNLSKTHHSYLAESQVKAALKHVMNYKTKQQGKWDIIKEAEVDVSLVKDDYILTGKVDLIRGKDNTVEIVDFKSQQRKPDVNIPKDREVLNRYRRQLEIYSHIVEERTGETVSGMHLFYTGEESGNPYITFQKTDTKIDKTIAEFDSVVNKIENKDYNMSHIKKCDELCSDCDMRFYCEVK